MLKTNFKYIHSARVTVLLMLVCLMLFPFGKVTAFEGNKNDRATEIRAIWLTTNWQLDWPKKGKSVDEQKQELIDILDQLQLNNFNLVLFQARAQGRTFYNSFLESKSPYYNHDNNFDPLAFAIEECHKRQMECHAWITVFPTDKIQKTRNNKIIDKKPDYYKAVKTHWYLDPGRPETKKRLVNIVSEITSQYDVDGIHLDYIRYPDNPQWINDNDTFKKYGKQDTKDNWRRNNVNEIVAEIYDAVKAIKPWVQVSSAPLGKYKKINRKDGWTAYESVSQDPKNWVDMQKHDILFPMLYYPVDDLKTHYEYWMQISPSRYVVPGLATYKLNDKENDWDLKEIKDQIEYLKDKKSMGIGYFRADQFLSNTKQLKNYLSTLYKYPAKLPPLFWLDANANETRPELGAYLTNKGNLKLIWNTADNTAGLTFNIYVSDSSHIDIDNPANLLIANFHGNNIIIDSDKGEYGLYYFVTSSNRYHIESQVSESAFFVHSESMH